MAKFDLDRLERQIDTLIQQCRELRVENKSLQDKERRLLAERAELMDQNIRARDKLEAVIGRLKSMEEEL